jgi:hypothetical protein
MCAKTPFQRRNVDVLSEALSVSKLLYDQNTKSWYSTILSLLKYLKLGLRFVMNSKTNLKHFLYTKLKSNYNRLWFLSLHDDKINKDLFIRSINGVLTFWRASHFNKKWISSSTSFKHNLQILSFAWGWSPLCLPLSISKLWLLIRNFESRSSSCILV